MAIIILILLSISFTIIFLSQKASLAKKNKYPKVQCSSFEKDYDGRTPEWQIDAINEYQVNLEYEQNLLPTHFEGTMQCFCNYEKRRGVKKDQVYEKTKNSEVIFSEPICKQYANDLLWSKILGQSIAFIIIAVNLILKAVIIQLCFWIGEDTESEQKAIITNGVFYAQFFNTGFLILLVNANLSEQTFIPDSMKDALNGPFSDYVPDWYGDVGLKILQTMVINAIMPIVGVVKGVVVPRIK